MIMRFLTMLWIVAAMVFAGPAIAADFSIGSISIEHPWSRPTPPGATVASGYVTLTNTGSVADRLIDIRTNAAEDAEIHRSLVVDGVASMRPVEGGPIIEAGSTLNFEAAKLHIMFIKPQAALKDGEHFLATLVFEQAGAVDVEFAIQRNRKPDAVVAPDHTSHGSAP